MSEASPSNSTGSGGGTRTSGVAPAGPAAGKAPAWWQRRWTVLSAAAVVLAGGVAAWWAFSGDSAVRPHGPTAEVTLGPMLITAVEAGELEAGRQKVISNGLRWPVVIKGVVSEGTMIQPGQVIIEFECKELGDAIAQQQITVTNASNNYTQAKENLQLREKEMANKVRKAEQAVLDSQEDLVRYREGQWPIDQKDKKAEIALAESDLKLAQKKLDFMHMANRELKDNKPYSKTEIEAQQLRVQRLELSLGKARSELVMLLKYDHKRELQRLRIAVQDAKLDLERARVEARTQLRVARAAEQAKKLTLGMRSAKLEDLLAQERKLVVKADKAGWVVYNTGGHRWRPQTITVSVGEKINPRQQLIIIPDMSSIQIRTKVYESIINQVKPGLKAYIRMDASPDVTLGGRVRTVSVLPDSQNRWLNPGVKVFKVIVEFDKLPRNLKPGMTAEVELVLARLARVLSVPVAAVFSEQERTFVYRLSSRRMDRVVVKVGRSNEERVEVLSGLRAGDRVLLAPPPGDSGKPRMPADEPLEGARPATQPAAEPPRREGEKRRRPRRGKPESVISSP